MDQPNRIADRFASELRDRLGEKILGIYLFRSTAKGTATEGSDIDVLVVYSPLLSFGKSLNLEGRSSRDCLANSIPPLLTPPLLSTLLK